MTVSLTLKRITVRPSHKSSAIPRISRNIERRTGTKWSLWWVMAHEIAHHIQRHPRIQSNNRVANEWDADFVAAYILGLLGAPLEHAKAGTGHSGDGVR